MTTRRSRIPQLVLPLVSIGSAILVGNLVGNRTLYAHEPATGMPTHPMHRSVEGHNHHHKMLEIPDQQPVPTVNLVVHPDPMKGWNLEIKVTNFRFAPERISEKSVTTEGHAHLYINGKKITRLYSSWYYLDGLSPGSNTITVSLNANGHEQLTHRGKPIEATVTIQTPTQSNR